MQELQRGFDNLLSLGVDLIRQYHQVMASYPKCLWEAIFYRH
jgi:hypothetical protein